MRYLFLLLQFFFFFFTLEHVEAGRNVSNKENAERDEKEFERHERNYGITLYNLFKFLGKNSYIDNKIKIKIDDFVGSDLELLRALKRINERREYPSLYLKFDNNEIVTENLFDEDEKINHSNNSSNHNKQGNKKGKNPKKDDITETELTEENIENQPSSSTESSDEDNEDESDVNSESAETPQPATVLPFNTNNGQTPSTTETTTNQNNTSLITQQTPQTAETQTPEQSTEDEDSNDQSDETQDNEQFSQENQSNGTLNNGQFNPNLAVVPINGQLPPSDTINLLGDDFMNNGSFNQNSGGSLINNGTVYNGTVNQTYNNSSDGTSWGGILGGVVGGAALGVLGTTLYNSRDNQNEYGMMNNYNNQNQRGPAVAEQDSLPSVILSDDSANLNNPQDSYDQINYSEQEPTLSNLEDVPEESIENNDDYDQNSENDQLEKVENEENDLMDTQEENIEEVNNGTLIQNFENDQNVEFQNEENMEEDIENNLTNIQGNVGEVVNNVLMDTYQQPIQMMESQIPNNVNLLPQFGAQIPYYVAPPQLFEMQTPYNINSFQQFAQSEEPQIQESLNSYDIEPQQPLKQEKSQSILNNLIDQEEIENSYSTLPKQHPNRNTKPTIKKIRRVIKNNNKDIYIKSKKNTDSQQPKMSTIPVRQVKENKPLEMIQDLADNKIHAYHF